MNRIIASSLMTLALLSALATEVERASAATTSKHSAARSSLKHAPLRHVTGVRSATFPIYSLGGTRVGGSVSVTAQGSRVYLTVNASGLVPFSTHAIHVHAGSCRTAYTGMHLYILGFPTANGAGRLTARGLGPSPYMAGSDYVIVYANTAPSLIVGCANLGPLR
jgi:hypothetical protein